MKIIILYYICVIVLYFLAPVSYEYDSLTYSVGFMVSSGVLAIGIYWVGKRRLELHRSSVSLSMSQGFLGLFFAIYYAYFYTGLLPSDIVSLEVSRYASYQAFFAEQELGMFGLYKVPAIISFMWLKFLLLKGVYGLYFGRNNYFYLMVIVLGYLYVGYARGTFFEFFEVLVLFCFGFFERYRKVSFPALLAFSTVFILFVLLFSANLSSRGVQSTPECITESMCFAYNSNSHTPDALNSLLYRMSGYFSFGPYLGGVYLDVNDLGQLIVGDYINACLIIDCGVNWTPELIRVLTLGGLFLVVFIYGIILLLARVSSIRMNLYSFSVRYYIVLIAMSIVNGNYFMASLPNVGLFILLLAGMFLFKSQESRGR